MSSIRRYLGKQKPPLGKTPFSRPSLRHGCEWDHGQGQGVSCWVSKDTHRGRPSDEAMNPSQEFTAFIAFDGSLYHRKLLGSPTFSYLMIPKSNHYKQNSLKTTFPWFCKDTTAHLSLWQSAVRQSGSPVGLGSNRAVLKSPQRYTPFWGTLIDKASWSS